MLGFMVFWNQIIFVEIWINFNRKFIVASINLKSSKEIIRKSNIKKCAENVGTYIEVRFYGICNKLKFG